MGQLEDRHLERQLAEMGFRFERRNKHPVLRHENGKILVVAASGSDHRGHKNLLSRARQIAGVESPAKTKRAPEKRRKGPLAHRQALLEHARQRGLKLTNNQASVLLTKHGSLPAAKRWIDRAVEAATNR